MNFSPEVGGNVPTVEDRLPLFFAKSDMETPRVHDLVPGRNLGELRFRKLAKLVST